MKVEVYLKVQSLEDALHFQYLVLLKGDLRITLPWLPLTPLASHFSTEVQRAAPLWFPWFSLPGEKLRRSRVVEQTLVPALQLVLESRLALSLSFTAHSKFILFSIFTSTDIGGFPAS